MNLRTNIILLLVNCIVCFEINEELFASPMAATHDTVVVPEKSIWERWWKKSEKERKAILKPRSQMEVDLRQHELTRETLRRLQDADDKICTLNCANLRKPPKPTSKLRMFSDILSTPPATEHHRMGIAADTRGIQRNFSPDLRKAQRTSSQIKNIRVLSRINKLQNEIAQLNSEINVAVRRAQNNQHGKKVLTKKKFSELTATISSVDNARVAHKLLAQRSNDRIREKILDRKQKKASIKQQRQQQLKLLLGRQVELDKDRKTEVEVPKLSNSEMKQILAQMDWERNAQILAKTDRKIMARLRLSQGQQINSDVLYDDYDEELQETNNPIPIQRGKFPVTFNHKPKDEIKTKITRHSPFGAHQLIESSVEFGDQPSQIATRVAVGGRGILRQNRPKISHPFRKSHFRKQIPSNKISFSELMSDFLVRNPLPFSG